MDRLRFKDICQENRKQEKAGIGILAEKKLHYVLKNYYEDNKQNQEIKVDKYTVDIKKDNEIIEIQTQNFNQLREKLNVLLSNYNIRIVYPLAKLKWLGWINQDTGEISTRRKSPKQGSFYDAFKELYKIKIFLNNPHLAIDLLLLEIEEYRHLDGWNKTKKKGSTRYERFPIDLIEVYSLNSLNDYTIFLPKNLPTPFTTKDYQKETKLTLRRTQEAINVLHYLGIIKRVGKNGKTYLYEKGEL